MSTVTPKSSGRKKKLHEPGSPERPSLEQNAGPPRRKWRRRVVICSGLLLLIVWGLPMIVAQTPLRNLVVGLLATDLNGEIRCDSASLGWFSPALLKGVTISGNDDQKTAIVDGATITSSKGLLNLIFSDGHLGTIQIRQPKFYVALRGDGSNVEDLIAPLLSAEDTDTDPIDLTVEMTDAVITIDDTASGQRSLLSKTNLSLVMSHDPAEPMRMTASGNVNDGKRSGRIVLDLTLGRSAALTVTSEDLPIGPLASLARRMDPRLSAAGRLTCQMNARWNMAESKPDVSLRGEIALNDLDLRATFLGSDRLKLNRLAGPCDLSLAEGRLGLKRLALECDLGTIDAASEIDLANLEWATLSKTLAKKETRLYVSLDLARTAAMLPNTLGMKKTAQLTSGKIELTVLGTDENLNRPGQAELLVTDLSGVNKGRLLQWKQPLKLGLVLRESAAGRSVGELHCQSNFLEINASGTFDQFTGSARFDVGKLAAELGQFVDLEALRLSGRGDGAFNWHRDVDGVFGAFASMNLYDFRLNGTAGRIWQEDHLRAKLHATGILDESTLESVYSGKLDLESSGEQIALQLAEPVFHLDELPNWPLKLRFVGNLANWAARVSRWADLGDTQVTGQCELTSDLVVSNRDVGLSNLNAKLTDLECRGDGWLVHEADARLSAALKWVAENQKMAISHATFKSNALAVNAQNVTIAMPASGPVSATGLASYRADLSRIQAWFADRQTAPTTTLEGTLGGEIKAGWEQGRLKLETQSDAEHVRLVQWTRQPGNRTSGQIVWSEPKSRFVLQANYRPRQETLELERLEIVSPETFEFKASGKISELAGRRLSDLSGSIHYDLERLSLLLRPWLGSQVQFKGKGPRKFFVKGPLADVVSIPAELAAQGEIGWSSGNVFGLPLGQGELKIGLGRGAIKITPIDLQLSEGRLTLAPTVRTVRDQTLVLLPNGPLLSKVRLTPQMCASAMKYLHPFLAGATHVDGHVSVDLQNSSIPIDAPRRANIAGELHIHSVQIADGPLVRQLLPLLAVRPQRVPLTEKVEFWVDRERVYHRGVGITIGTTTITTRGSVGLVDETLDLVAEMPVPEQWLGRNVLGTALRNQVIQIPIGGTLSEPKIDARRLDQMRDQLMREAAGNLIRDELLPKLFRP